MCPFHDSKECNGQGTCHGEYQGTGIKGCKCFAGWEGNACQHMKCPKWRANGSVCGGSTRGSCTQDTGMCRCNPGYSGLDCGAGRGPAMDA